VVLCVLVAVAACSKQSAQTTTTAESPSPAALASVAATAAASAAPGVDTGSPAPAGGAVSAPASAEATATPTPSPPPNLLQPDSGTIVRSYSPEANNGDARSLARDGFAVPDTASGPWVVVFELPGTATLTSLAATLPGKTDDGQGATATFALSTTTATTGFSDVGNVSSIKDAVVQTIALNNQRARWVRVTVTRTGKQQPISRIAAFGTFGPASTPIAGTYVQYAEPYKAGAFVSAPSEADPWYLRAVTVGQNGINGEQCFARHTGDSYPGTFDGRTWQWKRPGGSAGIFVVNDEATVLVANQNGSIAYWVRTPQQPLFCAPQVIGSGASNVLVLEEAGFHGVYPLDADGAKSFPNLRFSRLPASLVDQAALNTASTVVFDGLCDADALLTTSQNDAIAAWVQNGHKLLIIDADECGKPTHYAALPYQFVSNNPGAHGAKGDRLIIVEDDSLGTSDKTDAAHAFDPAPWVANVNNQLGDANTVTTQDSHWCGHLFGTNVNNVNGFMQMYAPYGTGLFIYDGFDEDDSGKPEYNRVRRLELTQPIPSDLPCTQKVSLSFLIEPNRNGTFVPGSAVTKTFAMELLANQGWKGHVNLTTSGDFKGTVTPSSLDIAGGTHPLKIAVSIPASAKAGDYAVIVSGDGGGGQTAQATIQFHANVAMLKQLKQQRRIRIYGIHFDVDKATIKPQSEPVIKQIADVMKQNPSFRFRVEGHTDSDGGLQHNQVLSQHRAESVVNDLVKRYHIAKSRLVPVGYGYSKPVAPNTTSAGKALNRRVELFLLSGK
jgi:outer membrane protein OmpA-like peptidoglycan-associated protein